MAKLERYAVNKTSVVRPVGIVPATSLKASARSIQQFAQVADQFSDLFQEKALTKARQQAEQDVVTTPTQKYQEAFLDTENSYVTDANGNPVNAEFISQIPRRDPGLFDNKYNKTWNNIASQRNANNATLTAWGQMDAWHADRLEDLDFGLFEATSQSYLETTLSKLDPRIQASVAMKLQPRQQTLYNDLRTKKIARDRKLNKEARESTISSFMGQLETGILNHGIDDPGLRQIYTNLADTIYSGVTVGDYPVEAAVRALNDAGSRLARGQLIGQINDMLPNGISPEEDLKMAEITSAIGIGDIKVKTLRFDPESKSIAVEEVSISSLIPDAKERRSLAIDLSNIAARQRDLTVSHQKLEAAAWQDSMAEFQNIATIATRDGDTEAYDRAVSGIAALESSIRTSNNEAKADMVQKTLQARAFIYERGDMAQTEREYLASLQEMENALKPELLAAVPGYYLDEEDRKAFVSGQTLSNRIERLKGQHTVLSNYIKELSKPAKGQEEFAGYIRNRTGSLNPTKDARNFADQYLRTYHNVEEIDWQEGGFREAISKAAPVLRTGIIPPSLAADLVSAISSGDAERIQNAYKVYEYMDNHRKFLTKDNVKNQIGNEAFRTYEYMRSAIELAGTFPTDVNFLERVQKVFNGETRLHWKDLDREARDAATGYIDEQLDPWFGFDKPRFPNKMRNELYSIIPETYEEAEGDMPSAGRQAAELAYDRITKTRWGHGDPFMFGEGWTEYPVSKAYPKLSQQAVKNFVRFEIQDRTDGDYLFAPNEAAPVGTGTKLIFHRMGRDGQPVYKLVRNNVENIVGQDLIGTEVLDRDGHIVEIDLRPLSREVSIIRNGITKTDQALEAMTNMYWRNPTPEVRADIEALVVIRNAMTRHPQTSVPVGPIDIDWHDESPMGGKPGIRAIDRLPSECPPGYRMGPKGCYRVATKGIHRTELGERTTQKIPAKDRKDLAGHYDSWVTGQKYSELPVKSFDWWYFNKYKK